MLVSSCHSDSYFHSKFLVGFVLSGGITKKCKVYFIHVMIYGVQSVIPSQGLSSSSPRIYVLICSTNLGFALKWQGILQTLIS